MASSLTPLAAYPCCSLWQVPWRSHEWPLAPNEYRQVYREMIEDGDNLKINDPAAYSEMYGDEDPSIRRAELERGVRMTDRELVELVERSVKWGI